MFGRFTARLAGYQEAKERYADSRGRAANEVWKLWITERLRDDKSPPLFAPPELVDEVRADLARERPGL